MNLDEAKWINRGSFNLYGTDRIFRIQEGKGPHLLIIQGLSTSSSSWVSLVDGLKSHFRVLLPDLMGLGFSDRPKRYSYSLEDSVKQIVYLLKKNRISSFHILAHDFGINLSCLLIPKIKEELREAKLLSVSFIFDKNFFIPKPYHWDPKSPHWVKIPKYTPTKSKRIKLHKFSDGNLDFVNRIYPIGLSGVFQRIFNKDLIPKELAKLDTDKDYYFMFSPLNQLKIPISLFVTNPIQPQNEESIKKIKNLIPKAKVRRFSFHSESYLLEVNLPELTSFYLKIHQKFIKT
ncbi:alpha/beta fold hydrolase [Algoriphagus confluentis]|uniref:AB hydrolase-1 domain-containing protein n=1 Tax=Algoriphagus confluentis TaxID=1697556 RepID=A0ABQ6PU71_9BACT|nr:hypothetical protein Aconfl_41650 [Algoriphagus confluentis]